MYGLRVLIAFAASQTHSSPEKLKYMQKFCNAFFCRRLKQEDRTGADFLRAVELKAVELNHKAEIIERKERRELAALLARYKQKSAKTI
jgi:hypothetical protein